MKKRQQPGRWILDIFQNCGVDTNRLLRQLPEETRQLLKRPNQIPTDDLNSILICCEMLTGDKHFGLHLVRHIEISKYGILGYLLLNAHTVGEFLHFAEHYYPTFYRGARIRLIMQEKVAHFEYRRLGNPAVSPRHDNEWTVGFFVNFLRSKLGADWVPVKATFNSPAPVDTGELESFFGKNLQFDYPYSSFEIETSLLDVQITESDPELLAIIKEHADQILENFTDQESFESHVRLLILQQLNEGVATATNIASQMNMSISTFKRRLAERNLTFRLLRDDVIRIQAEKVLAETSHSIAIIAQRLGYSETSAFDRAFQRLNGMTPRHYRQLARKNMVH